MTNQGRRCAWRAISVLIAAAVGTARGGAAQELGDVHFEISCSKGAQARFDQAMALLHHMTYPEARAGFEQTAMRDRRCAMARWGIAMTLFQPLWSTRPTPADIRRGRREIGEARRLGLPTERERLFADAGAAFFREPDSLQYQVRIHDWLRAMEKVHAAFPRDDEATAWLALAILAARPPVGPASREQSDRAASLLLEVYRRQPDHPGAMHYLIHADDVPGREHEQPDVVGRYASLAPRNPHALHMPTHIYTRLGEWDRVVEGNLRAAEAALEHSVGEGLVWDEFPHAIEYAVYAYLQLGDDKAALAQVRRLQTTERLEPTFKTAFHLASIQARYALERHDWAAAAALRPRQPASLDWDRFAWAEAVTWFAKGLGAAHLGKVDAAREAVGRLGELKSAMERAGEPAFAAQIEILRLGASGWMSQAAGEPDSAVALVRRAEELEAKTPKPAVTPAPTLPAAELLGDLYLVQRRPADALSMYRKSLHLYPGRRNSILGEKRAATP